MKDEDMPIGKINIVAGLMLLAAFMLYGFGLINLRDFAPGAPQWIAEYSSGTHFESRLAHARGNLFAFLNIMIGYLLQTLRIDAMSGRWVSWLGLGGVLMPLGIVAIVAALAWLGAAVWRADPVLSGR